MKRAATALVLSLVMTLSASAQTGADYLVNATTGVVGNLKGFLRPTLTTRDAKVLDEIDFRVSIIWNFQGVAYRQSGKRIVTIYLGLPFMINMIVEAIFVGSKGNGPCMNAYIRNALEAFLYNSAKTTSPTQRRPVATIGTYASFDPVCQGAQALLDGATAQERLVMADMKGNSIAAVVLHEIGHHVLNHVDRTFPSTPTAQDLENSRRDEDAADRWALKKLIQLELSPGSVLPWMFMLASLSETTWEGEQRGTHPAGSRRALVIMDEVLTELRNENAPSSLLARFVEMRAKLESVVPRRSN